MSAAPYMHLYVADYLGDTQHLTTEQHGAYLLILMAMWRAGGRLPNDPSKLARIARVSLRRWHLIEGDVMALMTVCEDGSVTQNRLEREHQKAVSLSQKRSAAGEAGVSAKALKRKEQALANGQPLLKDRAYVPEPDIIEHSLRSCSDTGSSFHSEPPPTAPDKPAGRGDATGFPEKAFEAFWDAYPAKVGKAAAQRKFDAIRKSGRVPFDRLMAGLEAYKRHKPADREWCHPTTWLNQGRWEDEHAGAPSSAAVVRPVVNVSCTDARWRRLSERYRSERGRPPPTAGGAWAFPSEWIDEMEQVA